MKFTDRYLLGLKPKESSSYDKRENNGFVIRVYPSGTKSFQFVYRKNKKEKRHTIGEYPNVFSLAEAREKHAALYKAFKRGESLSTVRLAAFTTKDLVDKFLVEYVKPTNVKDVYDNRKRNFEKYVIPYIGDKVASEVARADIVACLKPIQRDGKDTLYNHTLGAIKKMYNWGIQQGFEGFENNPAWMIPTIKTQTRERVLSTDEIKQVLSLGDSDTERLLKTILYTAMRQSHMHKLHSRDISDSYATVKELKGGANREHRIFLVPEVQAMLREGKCFTGSASSSRLSQFCNRRGFKFQPRDIRRTVSKNLRDMGYQKDEVEAILCHSEGVLIDTYHLYKWDKEKKELLTRWAEKINALQP